MSAKLQIGFVLLGLLGAFVIIEPAPIDVVLVLLCLVLTLSNRVALPSIIWPTASFLLAFLATNALGVIWSKDIDHALFYFAVTAYLALAWFVYLQVALRFGSRGIDAILIGHVTGGFVSILASVIALLGLVPDLSDEFLFALRPKGFFKDPNVFGPYLVVGALFCLAKGIHAEGKRSVLWFLAFVGQLAGIGMAASRAAWGNGIVSILVFFLLMLGTSSFKYLWRMIAVLLVTIAGIAMALFGTHDNILEEQIDLISSRFGLQDYDVERFYVQRSALDLSLSSPFGIGPGQSSLVLDIAPHSTLIQILVENGVLGWLFFVGFLLSTGYLIFRRYGSLLTVTELALISSAAGIVFNAFFIDTVHWRHMWLVLGTCTGLAVLHLGSHPRSILLGNSNRSSPFDEYKR